MRNFNFLSLVTSVLLFTILFLPFSYAVDLTNPDIAWLLDSSDGTLDSAGTNDLTNETAPDFYTTCSRPSITGADNGCFYFDRANSESMVTSNSTAGDSCNGGSFTWCAWLNISDGSNEQMFLGARSAAGDNYHIYAYRNPTDDHRIGMWVSGSEVATISTLPAFEQNAWNWHCWMYNSSNSKVRIFIDNVETTYSSQPNTGTWDTDGVDLTLGQYGGGAAYYGGEMSYIWQYCDTLSIAEMTSLSTENPLAPPPPVAVNITNTSIFGFDFNVSDFSFNSVSYVEIFEINWTSLRDEKIVMLNSFSARKTTGLDSTLFLKVEVDGTVIFDGSVRSVERNKWGVTGFPPLVFNSSTGGHFGVLSIRAANSGNIDVRDFDFVTLGDFSSEFIPINFYNFTRSYSITNTNFQTNQEYLINKTTDLGTMIFDYIIANTNAGQSVLDHYLNNTGQSYYITRTFNTGQGTVQNIFNDNTTASNLFGSVSRIDTGTLNIEETFFGFDFGDTNNNTIRSIRATNESTNITNFITLGTGLHELIDIDFFVANGSDVLVTATISANSTDGTEQDVTFTILTGEQNTSNIRTFNGLRGNSYHYNLFNTTINETHNFKVLVDTTGPINIFDETLVILEANSVNLTPFFPPAGISINHDFINNTINYNEPNITVNYNISITEGTFINNFNCSLIVNDVIDTTQVNITTGLNSTFVYNTTDIEGIQNVNLSITCLSPETSNNTGTYIYSVDNVQPRIVILEPTDGENVTQNTGLRAIVNFTDENLFGYQILFLDSTGVLQNNVSEFNVSQTNILSNTISSTRTISTGNWTMNVTAWDSHTANKVKPLHWYNEGDIIIIEDELEITGDIKGDQTYFILSEKGDRHKLKITFRETALYHSLTLRSFGDILYFIPDSSYKGHFVYFPLKKWIDFEGKNIKNISITEIHNKHFIVDVTLKTASDEIEFESIGDLNVNSVALTYTVRDVDSQILTQLENLNDKMEDLVESNEQILEVILMLGIYILIAVFVVMGLLTIHKWLFSVSGLLMLILGISQGYRFIANGTYDFKATTLFFFFGGLVFIIVGIILSLFNNAQSNKKKDLYSELDY